MKVVIDRFEEEYAVVELPDCSTANIERGALPPGAKEGDVLDLETDAEGRVRGAAVDRQETERRKRETGDLMAKILGKKFPVSGQEGTAEERGEQADTANRQDRPEGNIRECGRDD